MHKALISASCVLEGEAASNRTARPRHQGERKSCSPALRTASVSVEDVLLTGTLVGSHASLLVLLGCCSLAILVIRRY